MRLAIPILSQALGDRIALEIPVQKVVRPAKNSCQKYPLIVFNLIW